MTTKRQRPHKKRRWPKVLSVLLALAVLGGFWFRWQQTGLCPEEITVADARLPTAFEGLRISVVSDVHCAQFGQDNETLLSAVAEQQPDLIAVTGDLLDRYHTDLSMVEPLCTGLAAIAPTYYITGNHEWAVRKVNVLKDLLREHGVRLLSDEYELWTHDGATLAVAGVDDPNGPAGQKTGPELRTEIDEDYTILLAHRDTV